MSLSRISVCIPRICSDDIWKFYVMWSIILSLTGQKGIEKSHLLNITYNSNLTKESHLERWLNNIHIIIDFAQVMQTKLCPYMLYNKIYCNVVITSTWYDHISIFLRWKNKIIKSRLHKPSILQTKVVLDRHGKTLDTMNMF